MEIEHKAQLLTAESKPYEMNGNSGISHRIRFNVSGEIFVCKATPAQVDEMKQYQGQEGTATFKFESRKENLTLRLVSFEA